MTKEVEDEKKEYEDDQYYYHPDHLGSSSFVTDHEGKLEEHLEYFPFGETWIEEESSLPIAFQFTAKELDSETGLYYFGARYYDPRTSVWQSADPILGKYLNGEHDGGAYNSFNLSLYSYGYNNPVKHVDPDGNKVFNVFGLYLYLGKGGVGAELESHIQNRHPRLNSLSPAMKASATKLMFEMENRDLKNSKGKAMLPMIAEEPKRTIDQQREKVVESKSKLGSLLRPAHLIDSKGNANAMDIGIVGRGQPDKINKDDSRFYENLNDAAGDLGLGVGMGAIPKNGTLHPDPGHVFNQGKVEYNPDDLRRGKEMYNDIKKNRSDYPKVLD